MNSNYILKYILTIVLSFTLLGCASYTTKETPTIKTNSEIIVNHSTINEVIAIQGEPVLSWKNSDGGIIQFAYSNQPLGYKTFIIKFDENGIVKSITQTMNERYFSKISIGMSAEEVRTILGPEKSTGGSNDINITSYNYSFCSKNGKRMEFKVFYDFKEGKVVGTKIIPDTLYPLGEESICKPYTNYKISNV